MPMLNYLPTPASRLLDVTDYHSLNTEHKKKHDKDLVLIFPGNPNHHCSGVGLFSIKVGGGLAKLAESVGKEGKPTLSLPTAHFTDLTEGERLAQQAIGDLYSALGQGYSLLLITRPKNIRKDHIFKGGLEGAPGYEPAFWGGYAKSNYLELAPYYLRHLDIMHQFCSHIEQAKTVEEAVSLISRNLTDSERADFKKFIERYKQSPLPPVEKIVESPSQDISNSFKLNCLFFAAGIGALALIIIGLCVAALPLMVPAVAAAGLATTAYGVGGGVAGLGAVIGLGVGAAIVKKGGFFSNGSSAPEPDPEVKENNLKK